ncbi:acetoin reductase family protein [Amylocystis lapponica]|nr:acetoin reductase family protein [Amylocystis lapponica]
MPSFSPPWTLFINCVATRTKHSPAPDFLVMATTAKGTAIITGSAQGIGLAIAVRLAEDGFDVALFDVAANKEQLHALAGEIQNKTGRRALPIIGDVSLESDVKALVDTVVTELGGLDVMVANAGIAVIKLLHDTTVEDFDRVVAVNQRGTFLCYKYAALQMIKQGRGGHIIGASSATGKKGAPEMSAYSSTKFAIRGLTQVAAQEYAKYGIIVNAYAPGAIETTLLKGLDAETTTRAGQPPGTWLKLLANSGVLGRNGTANDIAGLVSFLVSKDAGFICGQSINVNGGYVFD